MPPSSILPPTWSVPQVFRDRLGASVGRQRAMFADGHLLLVLHAPPAPDEEDRRARFFWRQPDGTWSSNNFGGGPSALKRHLAEYDEAVEKQSTLEVSATSADDYFEIIDALAPLLRASRNMHNALQDARQHVKEDREIINFRDRAYEIERRADLLFTDAKNSLDYAVARRAEDQAKNSHQMAISAHRLNLLAALFFPMATLSGIFGVNLRHGLEESPAPYMFLLVMGAGLLAGLVLAMFVTSGTTGNGRPASER